MHALWVSLKENVKCGNRLTDVVRQPVKWGKENGYVPEKENMNRENGHPTESQASLVVTTPSKTQAQLRELSIGDPSRKIVEMIFHKAWMNSSKPLKKVKTVFRVTNSAEVLDRYEKYREKVKKNACEQYPRHPRSIVDGNELLRFYGTTMRCCQGKSAQKVKDLCRDPSCCVCQIIQSNFDAEFSKGNGIQLSSCSKDLSGSKMATVRVKNERRAVIVCRIIAGTATHDADVDGELEGSDSTGLNDMQFSFEKFIVRNPSAILPCFVLVLS